ncbi:GNAT family N-acetyltransferase [Methanoculleus sp.]|uniref:GNAT family N-acetyltransferase n=1 Tax=Methanoculleus sp. TaxID=90427 RepID=UPI0025EFE06A|nr:GNAT family N-acetyltransferase [Methanoculleus sp.]
MAFSVELLSEDNAYRWEEFNNRSHEGTPFHTLRWKNLLEEVFRLRLRYYLIFEDREVVGICPFVGRSIGLFQGLNSIPHSEFNNVILDDSFDPGCLDEVLSLFAEKYSFLLFNIYSTGGMDRIKHNNFVIEQTGNMVLNLKEHPPETIWSTFSRNMRYNIDIFEKRGFTIQEAHQPSDIKIFYHHYKENLTHIKGDILPFSFFQKLLELFPDEVRIATLTNGDVFAAGWLTLASPDRDTAYYQYLALNRDLPNRYTPTYPVYWDLVNWAWDNGYEKLSFGRQKLEPNNPRFKGKAKFGAEYVPIYTRLIPLSKSVHLAYWLKRKLSGVQTDHSPAAGQTSGAE